MSVNPALRSSRASVVYKGIQGQLGTHETVSKIRKMVEEEGRKEMATW